MTLKKKKKKSVATELDYVPEIKVNPTNDINFNYTADRFARTPFLDKSKLEGVTTSLKSWYSDPISKARTKSINKVVGRKFKLNPKNILKSIDRAASRVKIGNLAEADRYMGYSPKEIKEQLESTNYHDNYLAETYKNSFHGSMIVLNENIPEEREETLAHEIGHSTNIAALNGKYIEYQKLNSPDIDITKTESYAKYAHSPKVLKSYIKYGKDPEEVASRVTSVRFNNRLSPNMHITPSMVKSFKDESTKELLNFYSPERVAKFLNIMASNKQKKEESSRFA